MPGGGRPPQQKPKPDDINRPLPVSLEDLFNGATKKLKVTRRLLSGEEQEKIVTVSIKPGWKAGTKVRYDGLGTEIRGGPSADIVCELFLLLLVNPRIEADHLPPFCLCYASRHRGEASSHLQARRLGPHRHARHAARRGAHGHATAHAQAAGRDDAQRARAVRACSAWQGDAPARPGDANQQGRIEKAQGRPHHQVERRPPLRLDTDAEGGAQAHLGMRGLPSSRREREGLALLLSTHPHRRM